MIVTYSDAMNGLPQSDKQSVHGMVGSGGSLAVKMSSYMSNYISSQVRVDVPIDADAAVRTSAAELEMRSENDSVRTAVARIRLFVISSMFVSRSF